MAHTKKVRLKNRVMQIVHREGVIINADADIKQVYQAKGTIIGLLHHNTGTRLQVVHQGGQVWKVQDNV